MSIRINKKACIGCGGCVEACPGNLIKLVAEPEPATAAPLAAPDAPCGPVASDADAARTTPARRRIAEMRRPRDCWGCTSCLKACPTGAVEFFLGADMGGTGATLSYSREGSVSHWAVDCPDGRHLAIDVDATSANKY